VQPTFGIVEFVNNCLLQSKVQKLRSKAGESSWLVQIKQPEASGINARSSCAFANVGDPTSHAGPKANNFLPPRNSLREAKRLGCCGSGHTYSLQSRAFGVCTMAAVCHVRIGLSSPIESSDMSTDSRCAISGSPSADNCMSRLSATGACVSAVTGISRLSVVLGQIRSVVTLIPKAFSIWGNDHFRC
jgi:hypothetical protein